MSDGVRLRRDVASLFRVSQELGNEDGKHWWASHQWHSGEVDPRGLIPRQADGGDLTPAARFESLSAAFRVGLGLRLSCDNRRFATHPTSATFSRVR